MVVHSLVLYLADAAPKAALWFDARQPQALINLADQLAQCAYARRLAAPRPVKACKNHLPGAADTGDSAAAVNRVRCRRSGIGSTGQCANHNAVAHAVRFGKGQFGIRVIRPVSEVDLAAIREKATTAL